MTFNEFKKMFFILAKMNHHISPVLRTFITDIFSPLVSFQSHPRCATRELEVVDCLEAYGLHHGQEKCRILMDDFRECVLQSKQRHRAFIMIDERERQVKDGERDPKEKWAKAPRMDSY